MKRKVRLLQSNSGHSSLLSERRSQPKYWEVWVAWIQAPKRFCYRHGAGTTAGLGEKATNLVKTPGPGDSTNLDLHDYCDQQ